MAQNENEFGTEPMVEEGPDTSTFKGAALQTAKNIIPSGIEAAKSFAYPFMHPQETMEGLGQVGRGLVSKIQTTPAISGSGQQAAARPAQKAPEQKEQDEAALEALKKFYADRYGGLENIKQTVIQDPVGAAMDLGTIASFGGGALARAPGVVGKTGKVLSTVGKASDPLSATAATAKTVLPAATAVPFWWKSGASFKGLMDASKAGSELNSEFLKHLGGISKPEDAIQAIDDAAKKLRDQRGEAYTQAMQRYQQDPNTLSASPIGMKTNYNDIMKSWVDQFNQNNRAGKPINLGVQDALNKSKDVINEWRLQPDSPTAHTIFDLDGLKRRMDELRNAYPKNSPEYAALSGVRSSVYDTINLIDPKYAEIMEDYSKASNELSDIKRELQGGFNATSVSKMRKLLNSRDNTSKAALIERLAEINPDIPYMIAGQELHPLLPNNVRSYIANAASTAAAATINPGFVASFLASSPRVAGATQYAVGIPGGVLSKVADKVPTTVRQGIFQAGRYAREPEGETQPVQTEPSKLGPVSEDLEFGTEPFHEEPKVKRATGGRVGNAIYKADALIRKAEAAKRNINKTTEPMLELPDEHVTKALAVAKAHI